MRREVLALIFGSLNITAPVVYAEPYRPLDHLEAGLRDIPTTEHAVIFSAGSLATVGAYLWLDESVQEYFDEKNRMGSFEDPLNFLGNGLPSTLIGIGTLAYGLLKDKDREINAGASHLESLLVNFIFTISFKYSVGRERPDKSSRTSFPSGHASHSFVTATSLQLFYGLKAGIPAYTLAGLVATARMSANKHYLSDTLFGATIGAIASDSCAQHHLENAPLSRFTIAPFWHGAGSFGLVLQGAF